MTDWITSRQWFHDLNHWLSMGLNPEWEVWFLNIMIPILGGVALFVIILILVFGGNKKKEPECYEIDLGDISKPREKPEDV